MGFVREEDVVDAAVRNTDCWSVRYDVCLETLMLVSRTSSERTAKLFLHAAAGPHGNKTGVVDEVLELGLNSSSISFNVCVRAGPATCQGPV